VHRLWSTSWFTDPEGELAKLRKAFDSAVRAAPPPPAPEPETEPPSRTGTVDGNARPGDGNEPGNGNGPLDGEPLDGTATPAGPVAAPPAGTEPEPPTGTGPEPPPGATPSPDGPGSPEPRRPGSGSWPRDEEPWPPTADPGRAIPLGPGERRQLSGPGPKALPASAATGRSGPIALPAAREPRDR